MATIIKTTFQFKRGSAAKWQELNLILKAGEPGLEMDTGRLKIGNGVQAWNELSYLNDNSVFNAATRYDFPSAGQPYVIYKAENEKTLYQWNSNSGIYEALAGGGQGSIIIDTELSDTSNNAIANRVVKAALDALDERINQLDGYVYVVNAQTHTDFPSIGKEDVIYKASSEKKIYQWNAEQLKYEEISTSEIELISLINGGSADGNNNT